MKDRSEIKDRECDFDWSDWATSYPELETAFKPAYVEKIAERAALYFNPTKKGVVCSPKERRVLFNLLVAHFVFLQSKASNGNALSGVINSVSEGSVSLSADTSGLSKIDPWLAQSPYGQEFWTLSKKYRSGLYIRPIPDPRLRIFP